MTLYRVAFLLAAFAPAFAASAQCDPAWSREYPSRGPVEAEVRTLAVFDVGGTARMIMGGAFLYYPPVQEKAQYLGWWDGTLFNSLGGVYPDYPVSTMLVADAGTGPSLYVAGEFLKMGNLVARRVARWDGQAWFALGDGLSTTDPYPIDVRALAVFDDGAGPALYAAGSFTSSGDKSRPIRGIARWDGVQWTEVGGGLNFNRLKNHHGGLALAVYDNGAGPALYVGGSFTEAGGQPISHLARWDGASWSAVGEPPLAWTQEWCINEECMPVLSLGAFDDGTGPALYVGGNFDIDGFASHHIARLKGNAWEPAGELYGKFDTFADRHITINTLSVQDAGAGPALYAGGKFEVYYPLDPNDTEGGSLVRWDPQEQAWVDLDANDTVLAVSAFDDGTGRGLWVGGMYTKAGSQTQECYHPSKLGILGPDGWRRPSKASVAGRSDGGILAFDDGGGRAVYLAGIGTSVACKPTSPGIKRLTRDGPKDVGTWADIDPDVSSGTVWGMAVADAGDEAQLYVYARLTRKNAPDAFRGILRWDGAHWSKVGQDTLKAKISQPGGPYAFDDGNGVALYLLNRQQQEDIYKLQDGQWVKWASGEGGGWAAGGIWAARAFDDGTGPALWIGGDIGEIEGVKVSGIARYRPGLGWDPVGLGANSVVTDFEVWDGGSGPSLYVSGEFTLADGKPINRIARWNGQAQTWEPLGSGLNQIALMVIADDGTGPALWAHGAFTTAGGKPIRRIAKWDGHDWFGLPGAPLDGGVIGIASADLGLGPTLYITGEFHYANGYPSGGFAAYHFCPPSAPCPADIDGDGALTLFDFLAFVNLFNAGDAAADCDGSGSLDLFDFLCFANAFHQGC